jgi:hypothetical protein
MMDTVGQHTDAALLRRGDHGLVHVDCIATADPELWRCSAPVVEGFPLCSATVALPSRRYRSMFGWVQLVHFTDNESHGELFELDPFALFDDAPCPCCWYGQHRVLFDDPSRDVGQLLEWVAHSFLATTPLGEIAQGKPRSVVAITGFSWGFTDDGSKHTLHDVAVLGPDQWSRHLGVLRQTYTRRHFADTPDSCFMSIPQPS